MSELWRLKRLNTSERIALKRAAGTLALNASAQHAFYKADLCREQGWEQIRYAALCMVCLWGDHDALPVLPMEECLGRMCWEGGQERLARRIEALLETRWGEDDFLLEKLMNLVRMIRMHGEYKPDFEKLAWDLRHWNDEKQSVQRRWLRVIYRNELPRERERDDRAGESALAGSDEGPDGFREEQDGPRAEQDAHAETDTDADIE